MMKTYSPRRSGLEELLRPSIGRGLFIGALVLVVLRLLLPGVFWFIVAPMLDLSRSTGEVTRDALALGADRVQLSRENAALRERVSALETEAKTTAGVLAQLGIEGESNGIRAGVLSRPPMSPYDTLIVRAEAAGVSKGMEAFAPGGVPIGVVSSVSDRVAQIRLFSSPGVRTQGWVGAINAQLIGGGGGAYRISFPRAASTTVGETVYLPGPGRHAVGVVARIDDDATSASVDLRIQPLANLFSLDWVILRETGAIETATTTP